MNNKANFYENRFGGSVFSEKRRIWRHFMTSYPTIFRKYTSSDPISLKIGTIAHFDDTSSQKKIQNDSDIFDVVMTSSFFADDVISDDFDDVITTSKVSESFWIFFCALVLSKWTIVPIFTKFVTVEVYFLEICLYYFILLGYGTMWGVYYRTFRGHVTPYPRCFFHVFFTKSSKNKFP